MSNVFQDAFDTLDAPDPILDYKPGDVVTMTMWGGGMRNVCVAERHADIKNGKPGFDGTNGSWGYDNQIIAINGVKV